MSTWGFETASKGSAAVGTASGAVLAANPNRRYARLTNLGTAAVYLNLGTAAAVVGEGIALLAEAGGRSVMLERGSGNLWVGAIQGISAAGGMAVAYVEGA